MGVLRYLIVAVAIVLVIGILTWSRQRPNRSKSQPRRLRLPKFVGYAGWLLVFVGFVLALASFTSRYTHEMNGMRVAAVLVFLAGIGVMLINRNWFVEADADAVRFRTIFGREKEIAYGDIAEYEIKDGRGRPSLMVRSTGGDVLRINPAQYDMSPVIAAIRFQRRNGRWPSAGDLSL